MLPDSLGRHVGLQIAGQLAPLTLALVAFPLLLGRLGDERFALLTIGWTLTGCLSLLDLGMCRALTRIVARESGERSAAFRGEAIGTVLAMMIALGTVGALVGVALIGPACAHLPGLDSQLREEVAQAGRFLVITLPLSLPLFALTGVLEGVGRFDLSGAAKGLTNGLSYVAPVLLPATHLSLEHVAASLLVARMAALIVTALSVHAVLPGVVRRLSWSSEVARESLRLGRWMTISSVLGPVLVNLDRFVVASYVQAQYLVFYVTPMELISRLGVIPAAFGSVLYPFYARHSTDAGRLSPKALSAGLSTVLTAYGPLCCAAGLWAHELFEIWLGRSSDELVSVAMWFAVGTLANGLAFVPLTMLQGAGRPDLVAKAHLAETIGYIPVLIFLTRVWGIKGAALAWACRTVVDMVLLTAFAKRITGVEYPRDLRVWALAVLFAVTALSGAASVPVRLCITAAGLGATLVAFLALWKRPDDSIRSHRSGEPTSTHQVLAGTKRATSCSRQHEGWALGNHLGVPTTADASRTDAPRSSLSPALTREN